MRREGLFIEYERFKVRYLMTQRIYDSILTEKEELFTRTQPKGITYDRDKVDTSHQSDPLEQYMIDLEKHRITERLTEVKSLLDDRGKLLKLKEDELRASKNLYDRIYIMRIIDHRSCKQIARSVSYSESQVYRILNDIGQRCDKMRKNV